MRRRMLAKTRLCLLFTPSLCVRDPWRTLRAALHAGVNMVQVREKEATSRELLALTRAVRRIVGKRALVIVNDRVDIALLAGADGVHLGQDDLPASIARKMLGPDRLLGISTHSPEQARAAWKAGVDLIGYGPIFATKTKGYAKGLGFRQVARVEREARGPVLLIGGIDAKRLQTQRRNAPEGDGQAPGTLGKHRFAVSSAILRAKDPAKAVRALLYFSPNS